jgi:hypothetical protein
MPIEDAGHVSKSSYFLGDPPPDPRFLASLGALSLVELDHCSVVDVLTGWIGPKVIAWYACVGTNGRAI